MIDPSPELPDDIPIAGVELPPKVRHALTAAGHTVTPGAGRGSSPRPALYRRAETGVSS
jgi:hypothetical protein